MTHKSKDNPPAPVRHEKKPRASVKPREAEPLESEPAAPRAGTSYREFLTRLGVSESLIASVAKMGYESPTPIQEGTIELLLKGQDVMGQARTGTGKTAAFAIPILERVKPENRAVQALVLTPTRELCLQVTAAFKSLGASKKVRTLAVYGGTSIHNQFRDLAAHPQVIVGTPGRVMDHLGRRTLDLTAVDFLVLDEADEMLDLGFQEDVDKILRYLTQGRSRQTLLFSATFPPPIKRLAAKYMHHPQHISTIEANQVVNETCRQEYYPVIDRTRFGTLCEFLVREPIGAALIFCRQRRDAKEVAFSLIQNGFAAEAIHGDLTQAQRDRVMGAFRENSLNILVATDVAARGLDIPHITHVINYNPPDVAELYLHRIGRTARVGREGLALSLLNAYEHMMVTQFEAMTRSTILPGHHQFTEDDIAQYQYYRIRRHGQGRPGEHREDNRPGRSGRGPAPRGGSTRGGSRSGPGFSRGGRPAPPPVVMATPRSFATPHRQKVAVQAPASSRGPARPSSTGVDPEGPYTPGEDLEVKARGNRHFFRVRDLSEEECRSLSKR